MQYSPGPGLPVSELLLKWHAYRIGRKELSVKFGTARLAKRYNFKYALRRVASVGE